MLTDPIADMLSRIRNANRALHDHVEMPNSRMKEEIARLLKEEGYIRDYHVEHGGLALAGRRRGQRYRLGDAVRARILRVDVDEAKIDLAVVGEDAGSSVAGRANGKRRTARPR